MIRDLDVQERQQIVANNYIGNLSYIHNNKPYIVPITYFYDLKNKALIGYSAKGHKISAMRENKDVSVLVTEIDSVNNWKSVLAYGVYEELSGSQALAKLHQFSLGVKDLIINKEHRKLDFINEFSSQINKYNLPIIFQINIYETTGKMRHQKSTE
ncbi:pyridoxamine 5'-phosphate oxidase family protein [Bizionia sediminis]|uniref:Pyridoxamine 5'-phosphate oxidase family protein n=1 Tax=Bizionia sediminis TaxID=1737064 RepID=A0ABW5KWN1_9FLAO